jgi:hypothetical protein
MRVETEGHFSTEHGASGAQEVESIIGVDVRWGARGSLTDCANQGCGRGVGDGEEDTLYHTAETAHGAEDGVEGATLGPGIHSEAILLVSPGDGDEGGVE